MSTCLDYGICISGVYSTLVLCLQFTAQLTPCTRKKMLETRSQNHGLCFDPMARTRTYSYFDFDPKAQHNQNQGIACLSR